MVKLLTSSVSESDSAILTESLTDDICQLIDTVDADKVDAADFGILLSELLAVIEAKLSDVKARLSAQSRTAKLLIRYVGYVDVLKCFILAERTGHWHFHLKCVHDMLNLFAATGHNDYLKSCRLYLQQLVLDLPNSHPWLYEMFTVNGFHSVRRTDGQ